jgi:hypothetical protein
MRRLSKDKIMDSKACPKEETNMKNQCLACLESKAVFFLTLGPQSGGKRE